MERPMIAGISIELSLLLALLFLAPWLAAYPGAYIPPWLGNLLGIVDAVGDNVITDIATQMLNLFRVAGSSGFSIGIKNVKALQIVFDLLQNHCKITAWAILQQSFISIWIKATMGAVALTALISLIGTLLLFLNSVEIAQLMSWMRAALGTLSTLFLVATMPTLLRMGASNDMGMALVTAVFNVHLGYGFWLA